jgi:hypothetical protein
VKHLSKIDVTAMPVAEQLTLAAERLHDLGYKSIEQTGIAGLFRQAKRPCVSHTWSSPHTTSVKLYFHKRNPFQPDALASITRTKLADGMVDTVEVNGKVQTLAAFLTEPPQHPVRAMIKRAGRDVIGSLLPPALR